VTLIYEKIKTNSSLLKQFANLRPGIGSGISSGSAFIIKAGSGSALKESGPKTLLTDTSNTVKEELAETEITLFLSFQMAGYRKSG
jgi:hypothetical protein